MNNIIGWIVFGVLMAVITDSLDTPERERNIFQATLLGSMGGFTGGTFVNLLLGAGVTGFTFVSFFAAALAALFFLYLSKTMLRN